MAVFTTGDLTIPTQILDPWLGKVADASVIASLSQSVPMLFGRGESFTYDTGEAEYVGEGANKSSADITRVSQTVEPFKFHKTVRMTEEVKWANEDHQLQVVEQILAQIQPALSRALDFGGIHGINPVNGQVVAAMTPRALVSATKEVEYDATQAPYVSLDAADALVLADGYMPSDAALSPLYASKFSSQRAAQTEARLYPNFRLSGDVSDLDGHRAAVSRTVSATGVVAAPSTLVGLVGDFSAFRWGIQRSLGLEMIQFGDPDGNGDLKRNNQVAFRAEVVYGWGVADLDAFVKVVDAV